MGACESTSGRKAYRLFRDFSKSLSAACVFSVLATAFFVTGFCQAQAQPTSEPAKPANPTATTVAPDQVVLKVGTLQITKSGFEQYLADLETQQGPAQLSRKELGDNYASMLMLSQQAAAHHLDASPEIMRLLAIDRMQILSNAEFARLKTEATPTASAVSAYYNAHLEDYDVVEIRRLFIWASASDADAAKPGHGLTPKQADKLAEEVRQAYKSGADASRIQKLVNGTPHGKEDVVLDTQPNTFQKGEMPAEMSEAAFALKDGQWTELKRGPGSYVFLHMVKHSRKDLKEVKSQIENKLQLQALREELESLKKKTGVWMDESYFPNKPTIPVGHEQD